MFDNISKFSRLFLIFTGNSVNYIQKSSWKKLENECTIAINHSFKIFDKPTYLFFSDKDVMSAYYQYYQDKNYRPIVYARDKSIPDKNIEGRYTLVPQEWIDNNVDEYWDLKKLSTPKEDNITPCWLLTVLKEKYYQGKIYLIGADFYIEDGMYHFQNYLYNFYKNRKLENKLDDFRKHLEDPFFNTLNIYNCNPKSKLKKYPFVTLEEILNE